MGDFAAGGLTSAGSTTLPISSVYGAGAASPLIRLLELHVWNTGSAAVALRLVRATTTGTRGAALTVGSLSAHNPEASTGTAYQTHTVAPTVTDLGYRTHLAAGNGVIWTWSDNGLVIPAVANAGIGLIVDNGTGQACQVTWVWRE